ncbi:MAG: cytidine deaminase [Defluviitaleaceae bacterium]|nr:cytidine deaminase [Defluviitaleaceae bacterium]MCL2239104.1 cytidine deaminase [Defluviitaleaceae bacterium]
MERISKENYYLDIAQTVASRSTCVRRMYGACIVKNDVIVSTGYCGAPRGRENCCDLGYCLREKMAIPRGERYEMCRSVHSEANAIIAAPRENMLGATLYQACIDTATNTLAQNIDSCQMCKKLIINAGIDTVVYRNTPTQYRIAQVADWITQDDSLGKVGY